MQDVVRLGKTFALAAGDAAAMTVRAEAGAAVDQASRRIDVADTAGHRGQVFRVQPATP